MKTIFRYTIAAVSALAVFSCQKSTLEKDQANEPGQKMEMSFGVVLEEVSSPVPTPTSKTYINETDGYKTYWEAGDKISVYDGSSEARLFTIKEGSLNGASATFTGEAELSSEYFAVYPNYAAKGIDEGGNVTISFPTIQTIGSKPNGNGALITVAKATDGKFSFKNVGSIVKVKVATDGISEIILQGKNREYLSGEVKVNSTTGEVTEVTNGSQLAVIRPAASSEEGVTATFAQGEYFISLLPANFSNGFEIILTRASDGKRSIKETSNALNARRSAGKNLGTVTSGFATGYEWANMIIYKADMTPFHAALVSQTSETWVLGTDLDYEGANWDCPVDGSFNAVSFKGTFDGRGHRLYNIKINTKGSGRNFNSGLFNQVYGGTIKNFVLGSKDGINYDGVSEVTNYTAYAGGFNYAAAVAARLQNASKVVGVRNFVPVTVTKDNKSKARAGGISAHTNGSANVIENCVNYGKISILGTPSNLSDSAVAGILGVNESTAGTVMTNCFNYGEILSNDSSTLAVGGLVGVCYKNTTLKDCKNFGKVTDSSTSTVQHYVGGTVAYSSANAVLTNVDNDGEIYVTAPFARFVGGILGYAQTVETLTNCDNTGKVSYDSNSSSSLLTLGGVTGMVNDKASSKVSNCTNSGAILARKTHSDRVGGICGTIKLGTIENCTNSGSITLKVSGTSQFSCIGGIVGFRDNSTANGVTVSGCKNLSQGEIITDAGITGALHCGGIIGYSNNSKITGNFNYASVSSKVTSSGESNAGGIIGMDGTEATISGNENRGAVSASTSGENTTAGGILGKSANSAISSCKNYGAITGKASYTGSIAGYVTVDKAISSCTVQGSVNGTVLTSENYNSYIVGTTSGTITDCTL